MTTDTMIVSTFDDKTIAGKAMKALRDEGFREGDIKILQGGTDTLVSELVKRGFDEDEARGLADAAEQGKTLLAALVSEDKADQAASIMDSFEAEQDEGQDKGSRSAESVPIVEEGLVVGKAKFATGGVRVTSSVEERPVEETVTLRDERVSAEQRPADRYRDRRHRRLGRGRRRSAGLRGAGARCRCRMAGWPLRRRSSGLCGSHDAVPPHCTLKRRNCC